MNRRRPRQWACALDEEESVRALLLFSSLHSTYLRSCARSAPQPLLHPWTVNPLPRRRLCQPGSLRPPKIVLLPRLSSWTPIQTCRYAIMDTRAEAFNGVHLMGKRSLKVRLMKTQGMQSRRSLRSSLLFTGTTLLRLEPEVVVPAGSELNSACHNCHKTIMFVSLKPCSGCNVVHYCSGACKKADEALHQE